MPRNPRVYAGSWAASVTRDEVSRGTVFSILVKQAIVERGRRDGLLGMVMVLFLVVMVMVMMMRSAVVAEVTIMTYHVRRRYV